MSDSKHVKQTNLVLIFFVTTKYQKLFKSPPKIVITYNYHLLFQIIRHTDILYQMNNLRTLEPFTTSKTLTIDHFVALKNHWKSKEPYDASEQEQVEYLLFTEENLFKSLHSMDQFC